MKHIFLLLLILFTQLSLSVKGQSRAGDKIVLQGKIVDEQKDPLVGAHVTTASGYLAISNNEGDFILELPAVYPMEVTITSLGFESKTIAITKAPEAPLQISLTPHSESLQQVEVESTRIKSSHNQQIDAVHVTLLPSAAGAGIEGLVKSQMGVSSNNELSSQYRVRGGNFDENLVYVNGQEVYRPFLMHSGQQEGLSFVNPDLVEAIEFSSGGFSSSYGDKMSSVLDIQYKKPKETAGSVSAGMLGGSAHLEGAALNQKLSWITGGRYKTNRYLLGSLDEKGAYNPNFGDVQAFVSYQLSPKITFDLLGYYSLNSYEFIPENRETTFGTIHEVKKLKIYFDGQEKDRFETGYGAFTTHYKFNNNNKYNLTFTGFRTFEEETYDIIGEYWMQEVVDQNQPEPEDDIENQIGVGRFHQHARNDLLGEVFSANVGGQHLQPNNTITWNVQYQQEHFKDRINEWEMLDSAFYNLPINEEKLEFKYANHGKNRLTNHRVNAYLKNESSHFVSDGKLVIDAGVRLNYYSFTDEWLVSPRLLFSYLPNNQNIRYRLSGGYYYQPPFYKEMRLHSGALNDQIKAQKSIQTVAGFDYYFEVAERPFKFTTEIYYKWLDRLIPYQIDNVRIVYSGKNEAKGYATGIDFKINGDLVPGEDSWATLSFMKTEEDLTHDKWRDPSKPGAPGFIPRPSDQRLNFSLFLQDHLPNNPDFKAHLSFLFGTGLPFGPPRSERYLAVNRMPPYRRVDLGMSYDLIKSSAFKNSNLKHLWLGLEVFNLPNIDNTISYFWVTDIYNHQYAVPNYLTSRRVNVKLTARF